MWIDPEWEQMLKESELVALVEVVEGGKFVAQVKPLAFFKGKTESEFYVTEFNNHAWPEHGIEEQTFRAQERYYLFLDQRESAAHYLEFLEMAAEPALVRILRDGIEAVLGWRPTGEDFKRQREAMQAGLLWSVWTPTAGDLPVEGDKVRYRLTSTSYSLNAPARDRTEFERFLKAALAFHSEGRIDQKLLDEKQQAIRDESVRPTALDAEESELAHLLAGYFLLGGRGFDEVFRMIADGPDDGARFSLARLLGNIDGKPAGELLLSMLGDDNGLVQGEVVRQVAKGDPEKVGPLLLAHLEDAAHGGRGPQGLMDPVRNQLDGGQVEIIRGLGELKYQPAAPAFIRLLENADNPQQLQVLLEALDRMGNREYPRALEKTLGNAQMAFSIAEWVRDHHLTGMKEPFERFVENPPEGSLGGPHSAVIGALGTIGDEISGAKLTAYLEKLTSREVPEFFDLGATEAVIGALGTLRYKPARAAVEQAFFYWRGIDSIFGAKSDLLKLKRRLEDDLEQEAATHFREFAAVEPRALVFLKNHRALADGSATQPEYSFGLHVDVRSQEHPELTADALNTRLKTGFSQRLGRTSGDALEGEFRPRQRRRWGRAREQPHQLSFFLELWPVR